MEGDRYRFLDIGGGAEFSVGFSVGKYDTQTLIDDINRLRGVRLAEENPDNEYIIFDFDIPTYIAAQKERETPNLHFVIGEITRRNRLPFKDMSMDRVEMNHMYSPLTIPQNPLEHYDDVAHYDNALGEACRVLKPGGTLAITEKMERLRHIHFFITNRNDFSLAFQNGQELGLDLSTEKWTRVTDPSRTFWTGTAIEQQKYHEERGDMKSANDCVVFTLELKKKSS